MHEVHTLKDGTMVKAVAGYKCEYCELCNSDECAATACSHKSRDDGKDVIFKRHYRTAPATIGKVIFTEKQ